MAPQIQNQSQQQRIKSKIKVKIKIKTIQPMTLASMFRVSGVAA